jgi:signal transduction histidine kinase
MNEELAPTRFLPAERASPAELAEERLALESVPLLRELLDAMPSFAVVLNARRQILFANRAAVAAARAPLEAMIGKRTGEALGCVRAKSVSGCGTTEYCAVCGAGQSMLDAAQGRDGERDCRVVVAAPGRDLDLKVRATRLRQAGREFTLFTASDRADANRRRALERLFFHDVLNTVGAVTGIAELLPEATDAEFEPFCGLLRNASGLLLEQITAQRDLTSVENGDYRLHPTPCPLKEFVEAAVRITAAHPAAASRRIEVLAGPADAAIVTDRALLMRVAGNMLKNALEAEPKGAAIQAGWEARPDGGAEFWTRNPSVMPREVQLQVFQRSFSTKGEGRGLGTYSIRLLTRDYLKGTASFRSEPGFGTEFRVSLPPRVGAGKPQAPTGLAESSNL